VANLISGLNDIGAGAGSGGAGRQDPACYDASRWKASASS
jgi:hypothetical protein